MEIEVCLFTIYCLLLLLFEGMINKENGLRFKLSLENMFFVSLVAYTVLPMLDCLINGKHVVYLTSFLFKCIILIIALSAGFYLGKISKQKVVIKKQPIKENLDSSMQVFWSLFWGIAVLGFIAINILIVRGGMGGAFNSTYRESYAKENNNIAALLYATMPYVMLFNDEELISQHWIRRITMFISLAIILIFVLMGNRNIAIMVLFAFVWTKFKKRSFNKIFIYGGLVAGIILLGIIAVMREYSIILVLTGEKTIDWKLAREYALAFSNGELGTTFAFERYSQEIVSGFHFPYRFGYSYFILPLINIIPSSIWPGKPMVYANYFSHYAFGGFDGLGYGFSPIYEAEVNYGILWWIVFVIVGFFIARCTDKMYDKRAFYNVGLIACLVLNFFRIDFSTCFKFYAMMWVFKWIYLNSFRFFLGKK